MTLNFGHGFLPRIGVDNYKAVDRCVGSTDLFASRPLELPWAVVDGAWAESAPALLDTLRTSGTRLLIDTFGWRYRYDATLDVDKLVAATWAPSCTLNLADHAQIRSFVEASLRAQAELGADAYLLPGWFPEHNSEDLRAAYEAVLETACDTDDIDPRPLVAFVGGRIGNVDQVVQLIEHIRYYASALYVQLTPIRLYRDSPSKLQAVVDIYRHARERGFNVIAGYAGALTPALRSLGIDAADAGLATAEAFDRTTARRTQRRVNRGQSSGGGRQRRMYFQELGRSLPGDVVERLLGVPAAAAEIRGCRMPCHRFRNDPIMDRGREHSLYARVQNAQLVDSLPPSMRATSVHERLLQQRSTILRVNGALVESGVSPLDIRPIDNQLAWMSRCLSAPAAA